MGSTPTGAGPYQVPPSLPDQPLSSGTIEKDDAFWSNVGSEFYVTLEDSLLFSVWNNNTAGVATLRTRILRPDGVVVCSAYNLNVVNANNIAFAQFPVAEGWLISVLVENDGTPLQRNEWFCQVDLVRGVLPNDIDVACLISAPISGERSIGWPFGWMQDSCDGQGSIITNTVGNPAAGVEFTFTVPATTRMRIIGGFFTLVTSAAVATRGVRLIVDDGANILATVPANGTQAASLTQVYNVGAYSTNPAAIAGEFFVPLMPQLVLQGGSRIRSLTNNIQGADQYSTIRFLTERWIDIK